MFDAISRRSKQRGSLLLTGVGPVSPPAAGGGGASFAIATSGSSTGADINLGTASAGDLLVCMWYTEGQNSAGTTTVDDATNGEWSYTGERENSLTSGSPNWNQRIGCAYVLSSGAGAVSVGLNPGAGSNVARFFAWRFTVTDGPAVLVDSQSNEGNTTSGTSTGASSGSCGLGVGAAFDWAGSVTCSDGEIPDNTNVDAEMSLGSGDDGLAGYRIASMDNPDYAFTLSTNVEWLALIATFG